MKIAGFVLVTALLMALAGCGSPGDFDHGKIVNVIQGNPVKLDAEYVMLSHPEFDCGVQNDLWEPASDNGGRSTARLTQKGRDLKFSDDVSIGDMRKPYVQIRGDFSLGAVDITADHDGTEPGTKLADTKVGAIIQHTCFPNPLQIMGVRKGNFTQDNPPILLFRLRDGWQLEKFVH
jgi:hypothetical protein